MIVHYTNDVRGRHLGLVRHRSGPDGAGIEILTAAGWVRAARSVGDLIDMDRLPDELAEAIAIEQFRLELDGTPLRPPPRLVPPIEATPRSQLPGAR
jgi:hypothetical protein